MIRIANIDHVVIRCRDIGRMTAFYRDVLGCAVERVQAEIGLTQLRAGAQLLDLVDVSKPLGEQGGAPPGAEGRNMDHLCFRLAEFDPAAVRAELAKHGVEAGEPETRYGAEGFGPSIYLDDPEGNHLELRGAGDRDG
jgi:catechol 2,3-dioxygenase-like lactoylglutathione lyase family enzyme